MSKSNTRVVLGFAFAVASAVFIFASPASAQSLYVASGENAGGSVAERAALSGAVQPISIVSQRQTVAPVRTLHSSAMHAFADGRSHHADPDSRIMAQLERDCPTLHY